MQWSLLAYVCDRLRGESSNITVTTLWNINYITKTNDGISIHNNDFYNSKFNTVHLGLHTPTRCLISQDTSLSPQRMLTNLFRHSEHLANCCFVSVTQRDISSVCQTISARKKQNRYFRFISSVSTVASQLFLSSVLQLQYTFCFLVGFKRNLLWSIYTFRGDPTQTQLRTNTLPHSNKSAVTAVLMTQSIQCEDWCPRCRSMIPQSSEAWSWLHPRSVVTCTLMTATAEISVLVLH